MKLSIVAGTEACGSALGVVTTATAANFIRITMNTNELIERLSILAGKRGYAKDAIYKEAAEALRSQKAELESANRKVTAFVEVVRNMDAELEALRKDRQDAFDAGVYWQREAHKANDRIGEQEAQLSAIRQAVDIANALLDQHKDYVVIGNEQWKAVIDSKSADLDCHGYSLGACGIGSCPPPGSVKCLNAVQVQPDIDALRNSEKFGALVAGIEQRLAQPEQGEVK